MASHNPPARTESELDLEISDFFVKLTADQISSDTPIDPDELWDLYT